MTTESTKRVNIFCAYSSRDEELRHELELHLSALRRLGFIGSWHDRRVDVNNQHEQEEKYILSANLVLFLLSPDFMRSNFIHSDEIQKILEKHAYGQAYAVPILLHPVLWQNTSFEALQILPSNTRPISTWTYIDEAFTDVAKGIHTFINQYNGVGVDIFQQNIRQLFYETLQSSHKMGLVALQTEKFIDTSKEQVQGLLTHFDANLAIFNSDVKTLTDQLQNLGGYLAEQNQRLKDLTNSSKSLVASSNALTTNANFIGNSANLSAQASGNISDQLNSLQTIQRELMQVIQQSGKDTQDVVKALERTVYGLEQFTRADLQAMTNQVTTVANQVDRVASSLAQVDRQLQQTTMALAAVAQSLSLAVATPRRRRFFFF